MTPIRLLLADDHPLTLEGLRAFLSPHFEIAGTATDGRQLVELAVLQKPDLIILDITMPLLNGIHAAEQIKRSLPDVKLLFVTMHSNPSYLEAALNAGATGFVLKSEAREQLLYAIERVMDGDIYSSPHLPGQGMDRFKNPHQAAASLRLTARESEILQLIAEGRAAKEIGFVLGISVKTVGFHRENIKKKLGLRTTARLTRYAIEAGIVK